MSGGTWRVAAEVTALGDNPMPSVTALEVPGENIDQALAAARAKLAQDFETHQIYEAVRLQPPVNEGNA